MKNVSFVIPFRSDNGIRERNFLWSKSRLSNLFPKAEIIISDSGPGLFNRSRARNNAVKESTREFVVPLDADSVWNEEAIGQALAGLESGAPWVIGYDTYLALDSVSTERVLSESTDIHIDKDSYDYDLYIESSESVGGFMVLRRKDLYDIGGWDERFIGWGWEDRAFAVAADNILGPHIRLPQGLFHLWHPYTNEQTTGQPHYEKNRSLYNQYVDSFSVVRRGFLDEA